MLTLLLMRHAKSDWTSGLADRERTLNHRGRNAAPKIARHLRDHSLVPKRILCSSAVRTRETLKLITDVFPGKADTVLLDQLYLAEHWTILDLIRAHGEAASPLMVLGHNPGLQDAAAELPGSAVHGEQAERIDRKFPTAAVAIITFDGDHWSQVREGSGRLVDFIRPKTLSD